MPATDHAAGPDVVGFGEAMVLFQPAGGTPLELCDTASVHVAGAELNLCAAAARVGVRAAFCSRVGDDPFGRRILAAAGAFGVDTTLVTVDGNRPTGVFFKDVHPDGERRVHYYRRGSAASAVDGRDVERVVAAAPRVVAVSGLTAALGPGPRAAVAELARAAHAAGIAVAVDPNLRPGLPSVLDVLGGILRYTTYLFLGTDEAGPVLGSETPSDVFHAARAHGIAEVVLKAGAEGCWYTDGDRMRHQPAAPVSVVDPVGAGDALAGGYLAARLAGIDTAGAAWLGSQLAAAVIASPGDTDGLPAAVAARALLQKAGARVRR